MNSPRRIPLGCTRIPFECWVDHLQNEQNQVSMVLMLHQRLPMSLHLLGILIYQRERDGLFIRKVVVERADRRPNSLRDRRRGRCFVADFDKEFRDRVQKTRQPRRVERSCCGATRTGFDKSEGILVF
jgi:hypothetical protein